MVIRIILCLFLLICSFELSNAQTAVLDSLEDYLRKHPSKDTTHVLVKNKIAYAMYSKDPKLTLKYGGEAYEVAKNIKYSSGLAVSARVLGVYYWSQGDNQTALNYYFESLHLTDSLKDLEGSSSTLNNIGLIYYRLGEYDKSLEYYLRSLEIKEKLGADICKTSNNIGNIYFHYKDYNRAKKYFMQSYTYAVSHNNQRSEGDALLSLGSVHYDNKAYDSALHYYAIAENIYKVLNDDERLMLTKNNLANIYLEYKEYDKAKKYFQETLRYYENTSNETSKVTAWRGLADIYTALEDWEKAEDMLSKSLELSKKNSDRQGQMDTHNRLFHIYQNHKKYKEALESYLAYSALKDSIFTSENSERLNEMLTKYESEKKEKENLLLREKNELNDAALKEKKLQMWYLSIGFLAVCSFGFYLFYSYNKQKNLNVLLHQKNEEINQQKEEIESIAENLKIANAQISKKNEDVTASINTASRLQNAMLPSLEKLNQLLGNHILYFKPRDIVSGDFYWVEEYEGSIFIALGDCTGHGVPGAFMSILGCTLLSEIVFQMGLKKPSEILKTLDKLVQENLKQDQYGTQDGMDIVLCQWNKDENQLVLSSAKRSVLIFDTKECIHWKGDRYPIGGSYHNQEKNFTDTYFDVKNDLQIFLFTDGITDQFGGQEGKKFGYKNLKEITLQMSMHEIEVQSKIFINSFEEYIQNEKQLDDISLLSFKVPNLR